MDEAKRELTQLEKNLRKLEFTSVQRGEGQSTNREASPTSQYWHEESQRSILRRGDFGDALHSPSKVSLRTGLDNRATDFAKTYQERQSPYSRTTQDWVQGEIKNNEIYNRSPRFENKLAGPSALKRSPETQKQLNLIQVPGLRETNIDLTNQKIWGGKQRSQDGTHDYNALSDYVDPDHSNIFAGTKDVTALLAQDKPLDETLKQKIGAKSHAHNVIKLKALKLMDVYKQLQQAVFNTKKSPYDSFTVAPVVNDAKKDPQDAVKKLLNQQPFQVAADNILLDQKMLSDESLTDVINSPQVHILSALAIAEDNQEIFKRIVRFLSVKGWELPKNNGIYDQESWEKVRASRSSYLHSLVSEALQAAIQMDWYLLCDTIINYAAQQQFFLSITSQSVSALIENEAYDLMINLLANNVFLAKRKNNPFRESNKPSSPPLSSIAQLGQEVPYLNSKIERTWLNDIQLKKAQDSPVISRDDLQLTQIRSPKKLAKEFTEDFGIQASETNVEATRDEDLVKMLIQQKKPRTKPAASLLQGETIFQPEHIFQQLFLDKPEIARQDMPKQFKQPLYTLLAKLSGTKNFAEIVPTLILNGNREAVYLILQSKFPVLEQKNKKDSHIQNEEVGADLLDGAIDILDKPIREALALELFCFSVSQEQLDEAVNVYLKFQGTFQDHARRCIGDIIRGVNFSAAFFELKLYLLTQFLPSIQRSEVFAFLDCMESKVLADFSPFQSHRALLLQNVNPLLVTLQTMTLLIKLGEIEPSCCQRVTKMVAALDDKTALILESQPAHSLKPLEEAIWLQDVFDHNIVWYLQQLKPPQILNTQFCDKVLNDLWSSSYQTNNGSFLNYSTGYQIVKNRFITKNACTPSISHICRRNTKYPLHALSMPVWMTSESQRFVIDFLITLAFTITAQVFLFRFNRKFSTIEAIYQAIIAQPKPVNYGGFLASQDGKAIPELFIEICIMIGCGLLVAIQSPAESLLQYLYVKRTNLMVNSYRFDLCDLVLLVAAAISTAVVIISTLTPIEIARTDASTNIKYDAKLILNLGKHILNDRKLEVFPIAVATMVAAMWVKLILMFRQTTRFGPALLAIGKMIESVLFLILIWLICVLIFCSVIFMLYADKLPEGDSYSLIISYFESAAGNWEAGFPIYENARLHANVGKSLHMAFVLINFIGCFSILTAVFTHSYSIGQAKRRADFNAFRLDFLPSTKYNDEWGWMIVGPKILSPLLLVFLYPVMLLLSKGCAKNLHLKSLHLVRLFFIPLAAIYLLVFSAANAVLMPVAYVSGIVQASRLNYHQERFERRQPLRRRDQQQQSKVALVAGWIFAGPFILLLSFFADGALFVYYLFKPAGTHIFYTDIEPQLKLAPTAAIPDYFKDFTLLNRESFLPFNLPSFQTLYKVVAMQVVQTVYSPQLNENRYRMSIKSVVQQVRKLLCIESCVQMLIFGDLNCETAAKIKFISGLLTDRQSEAGRLQSLAILKTIVAKFKVDQDFMPKIILRNHELRGGLLWQMLKEKKMRVQAKLYQQQHSQGMKLSYVDFMVLSRENSIEDDLRELCVACPATVLQILRKECRHETQDRFNSELTRLQTKILKQQQMQILQSQVTQVVGSTKSTTNEETGFLSRAPLNRDLQPRASLDPAARLDLYHGTMAQQELIYTDISSMEVPPELAQIYSYRLSKPLTEVDLAALSQPTPQPEQAPSEPAKAKPAKADKAAKGKQEKPKKDQGTPQTKKSSKSSTKAQPSKSPSTRKKK